MNELIKVWTLNHRQNPLLVRAKSVQQLNSRIAYFRHYVKALPLWGKDACLICWLPTRCLYGAKSSFIPQTFHIARPRKMLSLQERIKQIGLVGLYNFPCPIGAKGRQPETNKQKCCPVGAKPWRRHYLMLKTPSYFRKKQFYSVVLTMAVFAA